MNWISQLYRFDTQLLIKLLIRYETGINQYFKEIALEWGKFPPHQILWNSGR